VGRQNKPNFHEKYQLFMLQVGGSPNISQLDQARWLKSPGSSTKVRKSGWTPTDMKNETESKSSQSR
jgi:hypothetical protein